ncbi:TetR/AcrR family transcriptional regulator, partial [Pseudonocardia sp. KRD291]|uniref:TetR/AcrR family transcriptional regulator n=1 Tax=Pseudonocardia sp. KRD291 TaxID=2792007 RepID=UPI001C49F049
RRIAEAAVELFGRAGWAGFSLEAVARHAGVGKASIYLRWETKERLLTEALGSSLLDIADVDSGTLRGDLVELARQMLALYLGRTRRAALRMAVEAPMIPGVGRRWDALLESQVLTARAMVRRGIRRGEVPADTSVTLLLDTLCGGVVMHVSSTPDHLQERLAADLDDYADRLVDFLLRAVLTPA